MCLELIILSPVYTSRRNGFLCSLRSSLDDLFADDIRILHDGTESSVRVLEINHWDDAPVFFMFDPDVDSSSTMVKTTA
jgi:hypothetical protein